LIPIRSILRIKKRIARNGIPCFASAVKTRGPHFSKPTTMKTKTPTLLAAIATLTLAPLAFAGENHDHDHGHDHGSKIEIVVPEKLSDLWKSLEGEHAKLSAAIEKKDIPAAHDAEQRLQAYLKAIPAKTAALEDSTRARIDGQAKKPRSLLRRRASRLG
jgi:hypothetical protein